MRNLDIRRDIERNGLKLWQIAYALGIADSTFSRKLRRELPADEKKKIRSIIAELKGGEPALCQV